MIDTKQLRALMLEQLDIERVRGMTMRGERPETVLALLDRLEAAERERDELYSKLERSLDTSDSLGAERDTLRAQLAACQTELTDVREHFAAYRNDAPALLSGKAERDTAEAIAAWLHERLSPSTSRRGTDRDDLNSIVKDIRSNAWRQPR